MAEQPCVGAKEDWETHRSNIHDFGLCFSLRDVLFACFYIHDIGKIKRYLSGNVWLENKLGKTISLRGRGPFPSL